MARTKAGRGAIRDIWAEARREHEDLRTADVAGLGKVPAGLTCVSDITVARDNNEGNARAQTQLAQALDELARHGKPVVVIASHVGDDFNDLIRGDEDD